MIRFLLKRDTNRNINIALNIGMSYKTCLMSGKFGCPTSQPGSRKGPSFLGLGVDSVMSRSVASAFMAACEMGVWGHVQNNGDWLCKSLCVLALFANILKRLLYYLHVVRKNSKDTFILNRFYFSLRLLYRTSTLVSTLKSEYSRFGVVHRFCILNIFPNSRLPFFLLEAFALNYV